MMHCAIMRATKITTHTNQIIKQNNQTHSQSASTYKTIKLVSDANASTGIAVIELLLRYLSSSRQKKHHTHKDKNAFVQANHQQAALVAI